MTVRIVGIDSLRPSDENPRLVMVDEVERLKRSIQRDPHFLEERPVLAQRDGTIYAGEMRWRALRALFEEGWEAPWGRWLVPVSLTDVPEALARERGIRDNLHAGEWQEIELAEALARIAEDAGADMEAAEEEQRPWDEPEHVLSGLGFRDAELRTIMAAAGIGEAVDPFSGRERPTEGLPEPRGEPVQAPERTDGSQVPQLPYGLVVRFERLDDRDRMARALADGSDGTVLRGKAEIALLEDDGGGAAVGG
jgi:hypothetical protein